VKKHLAIVAAAALSVGGLVYGQNTNDQPNAAERTGNAIERGAQKTGDAIKNGADKVGDAVTGADRNAQTAADKDTAKGAEEIHDTLAQVAEAALTKSGLDDMVERFVDADRNRLGQGDVLKADHPDLDGRIAELQKDWKAKYNQDFDIKDEDAVYNTTFARISEGEEGRARTAGEKVGADAASNNGTAGASATAGGVGASGNVDTNNGTANVNVDNNTGVDAPKADTNGQTAADKNLNDPGRDIATVHIAESHGMAALDVPMIHEAGGWKLDIPDSVDAQKLKDNVQTALTHCDEMKDKWSSDPNEAYRAVTHSVLLAIFDKPMTNAADSSGAGAANPAPATPAPAPVTPAP
jgi:hypothetical protein